MKNVPALELPMAVIFIVYFIVMKISPDVHVFIGLSRIRFPSLAYMIIMYWFP